MNIKNKIRADILLLNQYSLDSRNKSQAIIMSGIVYCNNIKICKPGILLNIDSKLEIRGKKNPYVSRGGIKLEHAICCFKIETNNKLAMDVGSSTGGFTDCLLQKNVKKVYSIDVGYGQLDWKLRNDERVVCIERQNIKYLDGEKYFNSLFDIIVMDLSFISIQTPLKILKKHLNKDGDICVLIKPQFELQKNEVQKKGIIVSKKLHIKVLENFIEFVNNNNYILKNIIYSPIQGAKGNIEFFGHLKINDNDNNLNKSSCDIEKIVNEAHYNFKGNDI